MLILKKLTLENLNSLAGVHVFDFEVLRKQSVSLFSLSGATGSGKSTMIDGVTLALYGRTARIKSLTGERNEVMTKGTDVCRAEVTFSVDGQTYWVSWSQKKGRTGKLQEKKWLLKQAGPEGDVISDRVTETAEKVTKLLGLDFDDFCKTVVLPQGQWSDFLKSEPKMKAELLRSFTGTEWAEKIPKFFKEQFAEVKKRHETLTEKAEGLQEVLRGRTAERLGFGRELLKKRKAILEQRKTEKEGALRLARDYAALEEDEDKHVADRKRWQRDEQLFQEEDVSRLAAHKKFSPLEEFEGRCQAEEKRKNTLENEVNTCQQKVAGHEAELVRLTQAHGQAKERLDREEGRAGEQEEVRGQLAKLEQILLRGKSAWQGFEKACSKRSSKEKEERQAQGRLSAAENVVEQARDREGAMLRQAVDGGALVPYRQLLTPGEPCPLCGQTVCERGFEEAESPEQKDGLLEELSQAQQALRKAESDHSAASARLEAARNALDEAEKEVRETREVLERDCGVPILTKEDWSRWEVEQESGKREARGQLDALKKAHDAALRDEAKARQDLEQCRKGLASQETELAQLCGKLDEAKQTEERARQDFEKEKAALAAGEDWKVYLLPSEEAHQLERRSEELNRRGAELDGQKQSLQGRRKGLQARGPKPGEESGTLQQAVQKLERLIRRVERKDAQLAEQLKEVEDRTAELAKVKAELVAVDQQWKLDALMKDLIGSGDDQKFDLFVQQVFFDWLISEANAVLLKLGAPHRLCREGGSDRKADQVYELWVNDGTSEENRTVKNLSGGETFLVSLAFALGLRELGKKVNTDLLFIDEGFGTLDSDSLAQAMTMLTALAGNGKMVGVISHVTAVESYAPAKFVFEKDGAGKTTVKIH